MLRYWLVIVQYRRGTLREFQYYDENEALVRFDFAAHRASTDWVHLVEITQFSPPLAPDKAPYLAPTRRLVRATNPIGARWPVTPSSTT